MPMVMVVATKICKGLVFEICSKIFCFASYAWFGQTHSGENVSYTDCNVANADKYASGCEVSSCNTGWRVSEDKNECLANECSCPNGIASREADCPDDGANRCASCDPGFTLDAGSIACSGTPS